MYVLRRFGQMLALWGLVSVLAFGLLGLMPGRAEDLLFAGDPNLTTEDFDRLRALRGLDRPIHERYFCWLFGRREDRCTYWPGRGVLLGELGYSLRHKRPIGGLVLERFENTARIMLPALALALLAAITVGTWAAVRRRRWIDAIARFFSFAAISVPVHWASLMAVLVFAVGLGLFPAGGVDDPRAPSLGARVHHAVLPVGILAFFYFGHWLRFVRSAMLDVLSTDYVRTARAKGLSETAVLFRHALPNALIPVITIVAQSIPAVFAGVVVIERVFAYRGMGLLIVESLHSDDHAVAMAAFSLFSAATFFASFVADVLYWLVDPRVRAFGEAG